MDWFYPLGQIKEDFFASKKSKDPMKQLVYTSNHGYFMRLSFGDLLIVKSLHFLAAGTS